MSASVLNKITHITADIFAAPTGSILVHACNTRGSWGSGIALAFKQKYPDAFETYKSGRAYSSVASRTISRVSSRRRTTGKRVDKPEQILASTRLAVLDLLKQNVDPVKELHACRFNSEKFGVPWPETETVLTELGAEMTVYRYQPPST
ncbi:hypothetical protein C8J57DRAFT_1219026 [Mycena rebaudengoi]|nr:hypothetical protein C8J57DRAFT_1219026 [Mycena rebaudengoi]